MVSNYKTLIVESKFCTCIFSAPEEPHSKVHPIVPSSSSVETLSPAAKKSLLMSALSSSSLSAPKVPLLKNPETEIILQGPSIFGKEERPAPEPPIVQITQSFKPPSAAEESPSASTPSLDAAERSRLELVKDYLSRVALAQAIAKQMMSREIREQPTAPAAPTMESILEARWSLLSRAQLQQQLLQQQSSLLQTSFTPMAPVPKASTMEELTRDIISENLSPRIAGMPTITLPNVPPPPKPILSPAEVRKNEIFATLGCLQPLPAKSAEMTFVKPLSSSVDIFMKPSPMAPAPAMALSPPSLLMSPLSPSSQSTSPTSKALRMFRKTSASKSSDIPEDLSSKRDLEVTKIFEPETHFARKCDVDISVIKPGTSLLKSSAKKSTTAEPEVDLSISIVPPKLDTETTEKFGRSRGGRNRKSFQVEHIHSETSGIDLDKSDLELRPEVPVVEADLPAKPTLTSASTPTKRGRPKKSTVTQVRDEKLETPDLKQPLQEPPVHKDELVPGQPEPAAVQNGLLQVVEDEEELSLSLHRKSKKGKSGKKSTSSECEAAAESKDAQPAEEQPSSNFVENVSDASENVDQLKAALSVAPRGRRGRPRKSTPKPEALEIEAEAPGASDNQVSGSEVDASLEAMSSPKKKLGRPRKAQAEDVVEQVETKPEAEETADPMKDTKEPQVQAEEAPEAASGIAAVPGVISSPLKTEEKTEEVLKDDEELHSRKKLGRSRKQPTSVNDEVQVTAPTEASPEKTSAADEKMIDSDLEENIPLKSRKRKVSGKSKAKLEIQPEICPQFDRAKTPEPKAEPVAAIELAKPVTSESKNVVESPKKRSKRQKPKGFVSKTTFAKSGSTRKVVDDVFDFKSDDDDAEDDDWLSQDRKLKQKLKDKLYRPQQRSVSCSDSPNHGSPKMKRERFFSEDSADVMESMVARDVDESHRSDVSGSSNNLANDDGSTNRCDEDERASNRGLKRRRSSFANSFYSQVPRRKVLRRTAARLSVQRSNENEALMTAIFDDDSLSNPFAVKAVKAEEEEKIVCAEAKSAEPEVLSPVPIQVPAELEEDLPEKPVDPVAVPENSVEKPEVIPEAKEELSIEEEFARLAEIPDDESFYDSWNRPKRARKQVQSQVQLEIESNRVVFPLEIRAFAVDQIKNGATKVQIARELDCPVSTVAGWWSKRDQIIQAMNESFPVEMAAAAAKNVVDVDVDVKVVTSKVRREIC